MVTDFLKLSMAIGDVLQKKSWKLATAESCTGGWVAEVVTSAPGSSAWFDCGWVTYSNASKEKLLGVSRDTLSRFGAVSEVVAKEMARGALNHSSADVSLAITGIAGPDGGTIEKPVGTIWFAWALRHGETVTEQRRFTGNRYAIRQQATRWALEKCISSHIIPRP